LKLPTVVSRSLEGDERGELHRQTCRAGPRRSRDPDRRFPWLSANTRSTGVVPSFAPYLLKVVGGVKVAVIGITTPAIPHWAKEENIAGLTFLDPVESVRRALLKLEAEKPDVILAAVHGGLGRDAETGAARSHEVRGENRQPTDDRWTPWPAYGRALPLVRVREGIDFCPSNTGGFKEEISAGQDERPEAN
jgi:hypothetical protein